MAKEIRLTKGKWVIVDDDYYEYLNSFRWIFSKVGAIRSYAIGRKKHKCVLMHRVILNPPDGKIIIHINGNNLDNRRCNLRIGRGK